MIATGFRPNQHRECSNKTSYYHIPESYRPAPRHPGDSLHCAIQCRFVSGHRFASKPYWPGPCEPANIIVSYFQTHATPVLICPFLQFGATICLGLFSASLVSRMQFLGVRSAGPWIALFGGFLTVFNGVAASLIV
jgi:hypothetical protein